MTPEDISNWTSLLLDPGQDSKDGKESTGLDARVLSNMIQSRIFPKEILTMNLSFAVESLPIPRRLGSQIKERVSLGRQGGGRGEVSLPSWAAWILMRGRASQNKMTEAIGLLHDVGIVPWDQPVFQDLGLDVVGMDLLADNKKNRYREDSYPDVYQKALKGLSEASIAKLNARASKDRIQGWEVCARTTSEPNAVEVLVAAGLSGLDTRGNVFAEGDNAFPALEAKIQAGANAAMARRWLIRCGDTVEQRIQRLEYLDSHWIAKDKEYQRTHADFIINTLTAGSVSISKDTSILERRGEIERWPVHVSGQGIGYTLLAIGVDSIYAQGKMITPKLVQAVEDQMKLPWWQAGAEKEAAGLEGTGVTEWQCLKLTRLLTEDERENDWPAGELGQVLAGLARQREIDLRPERIAYTVGQGSETWLTWAREGGGEDNLVRKEVADHPDDQWQLARLLENRIECAEGLVLLDGVECLGRAVVARHALEYAQACDDQEAAAQWLDIRMTTWSLMVIYGAWLGSQSSLHGIDPEVLAEALDSQFIRDVPQAAEKLERIAQLLEKPIPLNRYQEDSDPVQSTWEWAKHNTAIDERKPGEYAWAAFKRARLSVKAMPGTKLDAPRM